MGIIGITYSIILIAFIITIIFLIRSIYIKRKEQYILNNVSAKITDGYLIFTPNGKITNFNKAIMKEFNFKAKELKNKNVYDIFKGKGFEEKDINQIIHACKKIKSTNETIKFNVQKDGKIYKLEVKSIINNDIFLRYVILCKDMTQTYEIIEELHNNQDLMANREKFATLGQLISGIVHSLKSPIFAISGDLEAINSLIKEYEESVGDETVTIEDHYEIAGDMTTWLDKMKEQVESISDSITAIRSQVVALNNQDESNSFTVKELMKYIDILMKNTLKEYLIVLQFTVRVSKDYEIKGNLNSLVQAIDNIVMNSIESYHGKTNQTIDIIIDKTESNIEISIVDSGCGIPKRIQSKLFKEIITTNDSNKVGLGLFMAYSNIKAGFNGDIKFTSKEKKGSTFTILLPI